MNLSRPLHLAAAFLLTAGVGAAQTIYVDTSNDVIDFLGSQQVSDLPGADGLISLPEAGLASDNTAGVQTIGFRVPQSDWQYQWLYPGRVVLRPFLGFRTFDTVILDGATQTAFTGDTNPDGGAEVVIWASTYLVDNVGSTIRGLDNSSIFVSGGSANVVQGNTLSNIEVFDSPFTLVGGVEQGQGNTCGTIKLDRTNDCVIVGNTATRVRVLGWFGGGQPATNNRIGGPSLAERNYITGYGTWSSEGYPGGTTVQIFDSIGTVVENNWIGTTPDGLAQGSLASTCGVGFEGENYDAMIRDNRIAGILGHGIGPHYSGWLVGNAVQVYGVGARISILGNAIGLDASGAPVLGSVTGITTFNYYLGTVQEVRIGGALSGEGNEIAGHRLAGVSISNAYQGVRIQGNSIHDNGSLGIDLVNDGFVTGVTPNDALDLDTGGNGLQNFPVLQAAAASGGATQVLGSLDSSPSASFALDFYASSEIDPTGFGEGQVFLGTSIVATDAGGHAAIDTILPVSCASGWFVSATATGVANGSTSEFSACVPLSGDSVAVYCTAKPNSLGCVPVVAFAGVPQISGAGAFDLTASTVLNNKGGLWFYGTTGLQAVAFQGGHLCVKAPIKRLLLRNTQGNPPPSDCSGAVTENFNDKLRGLNGYTIDPALTAGGFVGSQFWSRDPADPFTTSLTAGISFAITP